MAVAESDQFFRLSEKDNLLLALLQKNAREPTASLARKLGVSRTTLQERIQRLENSGIISGYSVRINHSKLASVVKCFCFAACSNTKYVSIVRHFNSMDWVKAVHTVSGDWDFIIHVESKNLDTLNNNLNSINSIPGIIRTVSHIVMETKFDRLLSRNVISDDTGEH